MTDRTIAAIVVAALAALPLVALWLLLRDKRRGRHDGQAAHVLRSGLMEMQTLLEPERKVEVLRDQERKRDLVVDVQDEGEKKR